MLFHQKNESGDVSHLQQKPQFHLRKKPSLEPQQKRPIRVKANDLAYKNTPALFTVSQKTTG